MFFTQVIRNGAVYTGAGFTQKQALERITAKLKFNKVKMISNHFKVIEFHIPGEDVYEKIGESFLTGFEPSFAMNFNVGAAEKVDPSKVNMFKTAKYI